MTFNIDFTSWIEKNSKIFIFTGWSATKFSRVIRRLICDQRIKMELEILIFCTDERRCRPRGRGVVKYWNRRFHVEAMLSPGNANWTPWAIPGGLRLLLEDGSSSRRDTFSRVNYRLPRPYYYLRTEPRRAEAISGFISPALTRTIPIRDCRHIS